jgi:hypothetical protein
MPFDPTTFREGQPETEPLPEGNPAPVDDGTPLSPGPDQLFACFRNTQQTSVHIRIFYDAGGVTNFVLQPGAFHRLGVGDGRGRVCWKYGGTMSGNECPGVGLLNGFICND